MENQFQLYDSPAEPIFETTSAVIKRPNWLKILLFILLGMVVIVMLVIVVIQIGKNQKVNPQPTVSPTTTPAQTELNLPPQPTTDPAPAWKIYNSPEIGNYVSPFQLSYLSTWTIEQKLTSEEPKSLTLTLANSNNETIRIIQGIGGGGNCIYYDDPDYTSYKGAGRLFTSYAQLNKPALWRISKPKSLNETSYVVCEKTKGRYIDETRIGWIDINIKSGESLQEIMSILEKIIFKPTPNTKTLFD